VEGQVTEISISTHINDENVAHYRPHVTYVYQVSGVRHQCDHVELYPEAHSSEAEARQVVERYPVGSTVTVHHDPDDPNTAALDPSVQYPVPIGLGIAAAMMFAFSAGSYRETRERQTRARALL
jgi:hypothetical protein